MRGRGIVLARARADRGLVVTCSMLLLAGAIALTTLAVHTDATMTDGVRSRLVALPATDRLVQVAVRSPAGDLTTGGVRPDALGADPRDVAVRADAAQTLGAAGLPYEVHASARTGLVPVTGPVGTSGDGSARLVGVAYADLPAHAKLVSGHWPAHRAAAEGPLPVALHQAAAQTLGVRAGAGPASQLRVELGGTPTTLQVVGTWRPLEADDPYFAGDLLEIRGFDNATTLGPFVPADAADLGSVTLRWRIVPDAASVRAAELPSLGTALARLTSDLRQDSRLDAPNLSDRMHPHVQALAAQSVAAVSAAAVPLLVVAVLLAAALVLAGRLLVDRRAGQTRLVRARGASLAQVARWTGTEALVVLAPAAVLAAPAAWALLRAAGSVEGWRPSTATWTAAAGAAVAGAVVLVLPALVDAHRRGLAPPSSGRRPAAARTGAELGLLVAAAVAVWQLRRHAGTPKALRSGELAVDPVLVLAPALALLTGAVLTARLVPLVAAALSRRAGRHAGADAVLAAWDVARRPRDHAPVALLLSLAVGAGVLATGYAATWQGEQERAASVRVGGDLLVPAPGAATPAAAARAASVAAVPGVASVVPVLTEEVHLGPVDATLLAADVTTWSALSASSGADAAAVARSLADPARLPGVAFPETAERLEVDLTASLTLGPVDEELERLAPALAEQVPAPRRLTSRLWLASGDGHVVAVDLPPVTVVPAGPGTARVTAVAQPPVLPGGWRLVGLDAFAEPASTGGIAETTVHLGVDAVRASGPAAPVRDVDPRAAWVGGAQPAWRVPPSGTSPPGQLTAAAGTGPWPSASLTVPALTSGRVGARVLSGDHAAGPLAVVMTRELARTASLTAGARVALKRDGTTADVQVADVVDDVPGTGTRAALVDLGALAANVLEGGGVPPSSSSQWVVLDDEVRADRDSTTATLQRVARAAGTEPTAVLSRQEVARTLAETPPASAVPGLLRTAAGAALVLAALGAAVGVVAAGRRRRLERAVLRALGVSTSQARRVALLEVAGVGVLAVLAGVVAGLAVVWLTAPALVRGVAGSPAGVRVGIDPAVTAAVVTGGLLVVGALLLLRVLLGRRAESGDVRLGEDL